MIAVVGLGAVVAARTSFHPATALAVAAALSLCLPTPLIALALFSRATSIHAAAGALGSLATLLLIAAAERRIPSADRLLLGALASAAAGFVVGWSAAIFSPAGREAPPARHDLFIDAPLDPHV